jgi:hypothetical protein
MALGGQLGHDQTILGAGTQGVALPGLGSGQQLNLVQLQLVERGKRQRHMSFMDGVETATQEPDTL